MKFPPSRIKGAALRAACALGDSALGARVLNATLAAQLGIDKLATLSEADRGPSPHDARPLAGRPPRNSSDKMPGAPSQEGSWPPRAAHLTDAYRDKKSTPREALEAALAAAHALVQPLRGQVVLDLDEAGARRDADASARRWAAGAPLGPLDGVPLVVKEELAVAGLPRRTGTAPPAAPEAADAVLVARLRAAGAIVVGTSPMTEYGLNPLGVNPQRVLPRNPHHVGHVAGGSSTGSAVCVAAGLCPVASAADGGGSIRIPATLCGIFGLKPTFGRLSRTGSAYAGTMDHQGPVAAGVAELAHFLDVGAGVDPADSATSWAPPLAPGGFARALGRGVAGLRVGMLAPYWDAALPSLAAAVRPSIEALERAGATVVPVDIPLARLAAPIGYLSIGLEALADLRFVWRDRRETLARDLRVSLAALSCFASDDYLDAQRLRATLRRQTAQVFADVDLLAFPSTRIPAPPVDDDEARRGFLDAEALDGLCGNMFFANLTGLPAGVAPVGVVDGLPVALQLVGDAYDEATVLAALAALESSGAATVRRPSVTV